MSEKPKSKDQQGTPRWVILLILAFVFLFVVPVCVLTLLSLVGPDAGGVFSDVIATVAAPQSTATP